MSDRTEQGTGISTANRVFSRLLEEHFPASKTGEVSRKVRFDIDSSLDSDSYRISCDDTAITVSSGGPCGLLHGAGTLLRGLRETGDTLEYSGPVGESSPSCAVRAVYFASHFGNFYEVASEDELRRYVEELALWGFNILGATLPLFQFESLDDEVGLRMTGQVIRLLKIAKSLGLSTALFTLPNNGFASAPEEIRAKKFPDPLHRRGYHGVQICPSDPEGRRYLIDVWESELEKFRDVGFDYMILWPYDEGGCGCENCWPWGARGFIDMSKEAVRLTRNVFPSVEVVVSTWMFDTPPAGEWDGLRDSLASDKSWVQYILADAHEDFPRYPLDVCVPGSLPLVNFPEISMWGQGPWGGFGANPLPERFQRLWNQAGHALDGGFLYSEGIFEDLNKCLYSRWYWDRNASAEESMKEYAAWEFGQDVADDVAEMVKIMEHNHVRDEIDESCEKAFELMQNIEEKMNPEARNRWRWRILRLRALIDRELYHTGGELKGDVLRDAFDELCAIYHADNATSWVKPPSVT